MLRGLYFDQEGFVQQLGEVDNWALIIQNMEKALPDLHKILANTKPVNQMTDEELEQLLKQRKELQSKEQQVKEAQT